MPRSNSKNEIISRARKGVFDRNPLLATPHEIACTSCGCKHKITYLDHLKSGHFELGKTEVVEVAYAASTVEGLGRMLERITPIVITVWCKRCGAEASFSPVSLEYLLFTAERKKTVEQMYV
mgnify:CR=1 FL=1